MTQPRKIYSSNPFFTALSAPLLGQETVLLALESFHSKVYTRSNLTWLVLQGETCENYGISPYSGLVNFDNLLWSLLTLFTVTTLEGWHEARTWRDRV